MVNSHSNLPPVYAYRGTEGKDTRQSFTKLSVLYFLVLSSGTVPGYLFVLTLTHMHFGSRENSLVIWEVAFWDTFGE